VFAIGHGPTVEIYDLHTGTSVAKFDTPSHKDVLRLGFSPDGASLASICHHDDSVNIWGWAQQAGGHRLIRGYGAFIGCLAFSPVGRTLATGEEGGIVRLWNTETGQEMIRLLATGQPSRLRFSADGKRLASRIKGLPTGHDEVRVWSIEP
jgi:WD40 repeat protein